MTLHPDTSRFLVASGQVAGHGNGTTRPPHIRIWNYNTLETFQVIEGIEILNLTPGVSVAL